MDSEARAKQSQYEKSWRQRQMSDPEKAARLRERNRLRKQAQRQRKKAANMQDVQGMVDEGEPLKEPICMQPQQSTAIPPTYNLFSASAGPSSHVPSAFSFVDRAVLPLLPPVSGIVPPQPLASGIYQSQSIAPREPNQRPRFHDGLIDPVLLASGPSTSGPSSHKQTTTHPTRHMVDVAVMTEPPPMRHSPSPILTHPARHMVNVAVMTEPPSMRHSPSPILPVTARVVLRSSDIEALHDSLSDSEDDLPLPFLLQKVHTGEEIEDDTGEESEDDSGEEIEDDTGEESEDDTGEEIEDDSGEEIEDDSGEEIEDDSGSESSRYIPSHCPKWRCSDEVPGNPPAKMRNALKSYFDLTRTEERESVRSITLSMAICNMIKAEHRRGSCLEDAARNGWPVLEVDFAKLPDRVWGMKPDLDIAMFDPSRLHKLAAYLRFESDIAADGLTAKKVADQPLIHLKESRVIANALPG